MRNIAHRSEVILVGGMVGDAGLEALYGCQIHIVGVGNGHAIHREVIGERLEEVGRLLLLEFY